MNLKEFLRAFYRLLTFKSDTTLPRPLEIAYSILAWAIVIMLIVAYKIIIFDL